MRIYLKDIINRVFSIHKKKKQIDKQKDFQQCNDQAAFRVFIVSSIKQNQCAKFFQNVIHGK
jgi:hypothetical protein